ncbi:MAG: DUF6173 family protein [Rhizonema sp. PD37]|nr:DUF6173 family protein [Rhizonema sp. PD37]
MNQSLSKEEIEFQENLKEIDNEIDKIQRKEIILLLSLLEERQRETLGNKTADRLQEKFLKFQKAIGGDYSVGIIFVNYSKELTFYLQDISCIDSNVILFSVLDSSFVEAEIIQHVSQINFTLVKTPKI